MPLTASHTASRSHSHGRLPGPPPPGRAETRHPGSGESGRPTPGSLRVTGYSGFARQPVTSRLPRRPARASGPRQASESEADPGRAPRHAFQVWRPPFGRPLRARPGPTSLPDLASAGPRNGGFRPRLPRSDGADRRRRRLIYGPEQPRKRRRFVHGRTGGGPETPWQCLRFACITAKQRPASRASVGGPARGAPGEGAGGGPGGAGACAVSSCAISAWRKQSFRF